MVSQTGNAAAAALQRLGEGTKFRLRAPRGAAPNATFVFDRIDDGVAVAVDEKTHAAERIDLDSIGRAGERRVTYAGPGLVIGLLLFGALGGAVGQLLDRGGPNSSALTITQLVALIGAVPGAVLGGVIGLAFDRWVPIVSSEAAE